MNSYRYISRKAERLCEEMDDVTPAHGVPTTDLSDEDSAVISISHALTAHKR